MTRLAVTLALLAALLSGCTFAQIAGMPEPAPASTP
jgi:hypothetical protein